MPTVRPMSGLAAVLQTWPLGYSIGVRPFYNTPLNRSNRSHLGRDLPPLVRVNWSQYPV